MANHAPSIQLHISARWTYYFPLESLARCNRLLLFFECNGPSDTHVYIHMPNGIAKPETWVQRNKFDFDFERQKGALCTRRSRDEFEWLDRGVVALTQG